MPTPQEDSDSDGMEFTILKPSQMRGRKDILEMMNAANCNGAQKAHLQARGSEENEAMPSLYKQFAPPPRPKRT